MQTPTTEAPASTRTLLYLPSETLAQVDCRSEHTGRGFARSESVEESLGRYFHLLESARAELRAELTGPEVALIIDALNGHILASPRYLRAVPIGIEDAIALDGLAAKWGVDGDKLTRTLHALPLVQIAALVDAAERYWIAASRSADGGDCDPEKALA